MSCKLKQSKTQTELLQKFKIEAADLGNMFDCNLCWIVQNEVLQVHHKTQQIQTADQDSIEEQAEIHPYLRWFLILSRFKSH